MATTIHGEEHDKQDEDEEEALSLCDLPVKEKQQPSLLNENPITEDFDFNHWPPPPSPPPMCAADDIFFQGHLLPLRLSVSSDNTHNHFFSKPLSARSESMDHNMLRFRNGSSSSSSNSSRSHYSRCSSISNNSISIPTNSKPRTQNNVFHSHPSPTPQIRSFSTFGRRSRSRSSSRWDFFRVGLLRTPGMELHDLKTRTTVSNAVPTVGQKTTASFLGVVSCKKSVETIPAAKKIKNWSGNIGKKRNEKGKGIGIREKELNDNVEIREKEKEKATRLSHRRTFEWLKQLSHATFADQQSS
ncbi:uncharacterized protein LOC111451408 [Cucurbita moschata]|uniref:Uncharacterized protein LOC111451408 n=1 Tax=Cucurbita moschata TaxID=3662 RepID=A0A6J1G7B7_CUCMO|nr:uncharacterized protein LOC111451408 [Cucurbita moschata]